MSSYNLCESPQIDGCQMYAHCSQRLEKRFPYKLHSVHTASADDFQTIPKECRATLRPDRFQRAICKRSRQNVGLHCNLFRSLRKTMCRRSGQSVKLHSVQIASKDSFQMIWTKCIATFCSDRFGKRFSDNLGRA